MVLCDQWRIDVEASVVEGTVEFLAHHGRRLPFHFPMKLKGVIWI